MLAGMAWEQDVLAAVLPAVLAAAGGIVFAVPNLLHNGISATIHGTAASIIVALFALSLFFFSLYGKSLADDEASERADKLIAEEAAALRARWKLQSERLLKCSQDQIKLNEQRKKAGLEPLMIHQVCPELLGPGLLGSPSSLSRQFPPTARNVAVE